MEPVCIKHKISMKYKKFLYLWLKGETYVGLKNLKCANCGKNIELNWQYRLIPLLLSVFIFIAGVIYITITNKIDSKLVALLITSAIINHLLSYLTYKFGKYNEIENTN